ncbi:MAG: hypothetical protein ACT4QF_18530 [Sporichthyaceae bacterium]
MRTGDIDDFESMPAIGKRDMLGRLVAGLGPPLESLGFRRDRGVAAQWSAPEGDFYRVLEIQESLTGVNLWSGRQFRANISLQDDPQHADPLSFYRFRDLGECMTDAMWAEYAQRVNRIRAPKWVSPPTSEYFFERFERVSARVPEANFDVCSAEDIEDWIEFLSASLPEIVARHRTEFPVDSAQHTDDNWRNPSGRRRP